MLAAAMLTAMITTFMGSALNLSVPGLEQYFHASARMVSWVVSAYTIAIAMMSLPLGKIADLRGRRRVFLLGIAGFGLLSILCAFAWDIRVLLALRAVQGVTAAMIFATNNAILISAYPHSQQGRVLGLSTAATYIGLTAGPVLGGILDTAFGWRSIFLMAAALSACAFCAAARFAPRDARKADGAGQDVRGAALYISAVALSLYGLTNLTASWAGPVCFAAGAALIAAFFLAESRTAEPMMKVSMFRESRTFTFSNLAALLNYAATFAISYSFSIYLQTVRGFSSSRAGLILILMPLLQAVFSPLMGSLSDRIRPSILASGGMGCCALALVLMTRIGEGTGMPWILAVLALTGFGFAMFSSPNNNAIMNCVAPPDYGIANAIIATMRTYGQSAGMAILSVVTGAVLGEGTLEGAAAGQVIRLLRISFTIFAVLCLMGLFFSLARDREKQE